MWWEYMKKSSLVKIPRGGGVFLSMLLVACGGGGSGGTGSDPTAAVSGANSPTIAGSPPLAVTQDVAYSFQPAASDPDGDTLFFSIDNQPSWANFDSMSGILSGTPGVNDVGSYPDIVIRVSDGFDSSSLPSFSIEVLGTATGAATLSWTIPTQNADGTQLTDLAGFKIRYGMSSGYYRNAKIVENSSVATSMVENLSPATWFFVVVAYDTSGNESAPSNETSKTI